MQRVYLRDCAIVQWIILLCLAGTYANAAETPKPNDASKSAATIVCEAKDPALDFACAELRRFLTDANMSVPQTPATAPSENTWQFILQVDPSMEPGAFRVEGKKDETGPIVRLAGPDPTCVLHAVYTALERIGYRFEISGPTTPLPLDINQLLKASVTIRPAVQVRGPRLYMNFPMDLSSCSLDEAKEYVHNLARMRFNLLSFHSYKGVFIQVLGPGGEDQLAGNLFYGDRHDIPDVDWLKKKIHNQRVFCLPEIESVIDEPRARSEKAVAWLQAVMEEAKRVGLTIQFSFEPARQDTELAETVRTANAIVQSYPKIDILELVTTEGGGGGDDLTADDLTRVFGQQDILKLAIGQPHPEGFRYYPLYGQIRHNSLAIRELQTQWQGQNKPKLKCGMYNTGPDHFANFLHVLDRYTPPEIDLGVLPGYASECAAEYIHDVELPSELLRRLSIYSWLEFDGMMYLQQNGLDGIHQLVKDLSDRSGGGQIPYISFIHWRMAENRLPARYAALACLLGPLPLDSFYREYARDLGFDSAGEIFSEAMREWNRADGWVFHHMGNIGFCARGCWSPAGGLGFFGKEEWGDSAISTAIAGYQHVHNLLRICAKHASGKAGQESLAFMDHRLRCNILYLRAFLKGTELREVCGKKKPDELTAEEKQQVVRICDEALTQMDQWMKFYAELMPDRGAEGMLISFYHTPPAELKRIRFEYAGVGKDEVPKSTADLQGPPEPLQFGTKRK